MFDESRSETIKAGGDRRVGGEKISCARGGQRDIEGLRVLLHEVAGAFQHRKGRVPFIQVADFRFDAKGGKQPPA